MSRLPLIMCVAVAVGGCAVSPPPATSSNPAAQRFDPIAFFDGRTEGDGRLKVAMSGSRRVHVAGEGRTAADGALTLVQRIEQEGKARRTRQWRLRPAGGGRYAGELTDAVGPVSGIVDRDRLHIRFAAKRGLGVEQWLTLEPGGRTVRNHLIVRKLGVVVATLDETIRKID